MIKDYQKVFEFAIKIDFQTLILWMLTLNHLDGIKVHAHTDSIIIIIIIMFIVFYVVIGTLSHAKIILELLFQYGYETDYYPLD